MPDDRAGALRPPRTMLPTLVLETAPRPDEHPALVYLARLAPGSRRTMQGALNTLAHLLGVPRLEDAHGADLTLLHCNWAALRYQHTAALRAELAARYRAATANKLLAALRGVLKEAWKLELLDGESYQRAVAIQNIRASTLPAGRFVERDERAALLEACADDAKLLARRDAAMLAVLFGTGVRRSELVAFDLADYHPRAQSLQVRQGKGNKDRLVHLSRSAVPALDDWLAVRGRWAGPLFSRIRKGDQLTHARLSEQAVYRMLERRAKAAGVDAVAPHDFRRTFISELLETGADLSIGSAIAGHADPRTTKRYDRRGAAAQKRAVDRLDVPYVPRKPQD